LPHHGGKPRPRRRAPPRPAPPLVSQHVVVADHGGAPGHPGRRAGGGVHHPPRPRGTLVVRPRRRQSARRVAGYRERPQPGTPRHRPYPAALREDGINDALVQGSVGRVNRSQGSKLAGHAHAVVPPGAALTLQVRFSAEPLKDPFAEFDSIFARRSAEADAFYIAVQPAGLSADERLVQRQALAGLLWSKQFYHYDVYRWLVGDPSEPTPPAARWHGRNRNWKELHNADVILMPDTWEYPWYAS